MTIQDIDWWAIAPALARGRRRPARVCSSMRSCRASGRALGLLGGAVVGARGGGVAVGGADRRRPGGVLPARRGWSSRVDCSWVVDDVTITWWLVILVGTALVLLLLDVAGVGGRRPA